MIVISGDFMLSWMNSERAGTESRMKPIRMWVLCLLLAGCQSNPTAYFFISNTSRDRTTVDITVSLGDKTVFRDTIRRSSVQPDLQYTPSVSLPKGDYIIAVSADSGRAQTRDTLHLQGDQWIFITYTYEKPVDSAVVKSYGTGPLVDSGFLNGKLRGRAPQVGIFVMEKEPVHM